MSQYLYTWFYTFHVVSRISSMNGISSWMKLIWAMIITYRCWLILLSWLGLTEWKYKIQSEPSSTLSHLEDAHSRLHTRWCLCLFFCVFCCLRLRAFYNVWTLLYRGLSLYRGPGPQNSHFWVRILRGIYYMQYTYYSDFIQISTITQMFSIFQAIQTIIPKHIIWISPTSTAATNLPLGGCETC